MRRWTLITLILLFLALIGLAVYVFLPADGDPTPRITPTVSP